MPLALVAPSPRPHSPRRQPGVRPKRVSAARLAAVPRRHTTDTAEAATPDDTPEVAQADLGRTRALLQWAAERDLALRVDRDALHVLIEVEAHFESWPPDCWTEHGLWQFLWSEVSSACVLTGRTVPDTLPETLWLYLAFVDDTVGLAAGSDKLEKLQTFLQVYGDLDEAGLPRRTEVTSTAA